MNILILNRSLDYLEIEDMGVFTAFEKQDALVEKYEEIKSFGKALR